MDQEPDVIRKQIDETRSSLTEKLETLECQVRGTVENAKTTVEETIENVRSTVNETVATVKRSLDVNYQTQQHPWAMLGGSIVAGFLTGHLLARRMEGGPGFRQAPVSETYATAKRAPTGNGHAGDAAERRFETTAPTGTREQPGLMSRLLHQFDDEIGKVKEVAIGTAMGLVRDVVKQSLPQFSEHIDDIMNSATAKLGGKPLEESILERQPGAGTTHADSSRCSDGLR